MNVKSLTLTSGSNSFPHKFCKQSKVPQVLTIWCPIFFSVLSRNSDFGHHIHPALDYTTQCNNHLCQKVFVAMENERGEFDTFFTGLSSYHGTKPGSRKTNETFSIKFEGISPDNKIKAQLMSFIKFKFETCYDWSNVMAIALECLDNYFEDGEFQEDMELCIGEWLAQFEGWGLLFTLLPMDFQQFLLVLYAQLRHKYQEENVHKSNEELFEEMLSFYELETRGLPLKQLIPKVEVELMNIIGGAGENERNKLVRVKFLSSRFHLAADFIVHKKALRRSLVEIAAEAVAQTCEDVEDLEIPDTLKEVVSEKVISKNEKSKLFLN